MKKIKFRGKSLYSEKYFFGGYYKDCSDAEFIVQPNGEMNRVDSVAQLVELDANGNEVYEGDKFTDKFGHTFTARLLPQAICKNGHIRFDWMPKSCDFHIFTFPDDFNVEEGYCSEED